MIGKYQQLSKSPL